MFLSGLLFVHRCCAYNTNKCWMPHVRVFFLFFRHIWPNAIFSASISNVFDNFLMILSVRSDSDCSTLSPVRVCVLHRAVDLGYNSMFVYISKVWVFFFIHRLFSAKFFLRSQQQRINIFWSKVLGVYLR